MTNYTLLPFWNLRHRHSPLREQEDGVVAEAAFTPGLAGDLPFHLPAYVAHLAAPRQGDGDDADEARPPGLRGLPLEAAVHLGEALGVGSVLSQEASGAHPRPAAQARDLDPRVIGHSC